MDTGKGHTQGKCLCGHYHPYQRQRTISTAELINLIGLSYSEYDDLKLIERDMSSSTTDPKGDDLV